ncbi:hypothetical protein BKH46_03730 [Helicobacter sp. 12S02634-8]|uniref:hypothetical protein n=1 Tax=Helicobacter sp. 12S02634-8 TaxID=1476199 RepID=UPI000BA595D7|nr:hypothetical protein [Helicobacter sp. 12S02634-8]PAF47546.1 hypothetical protein BKH46_03730 [Helicobacter sp. 12S02634-8]
MRCYRLKNLLKTLGYQATIYQRGAQAFPLSDCHHDWLVTLPNGLTSEDIVFIDSYEANHAFYTDVSKQAGQLFVFDDYHRIPYPPNAIIINGALGAKSLYKATQNCLAGIEYSLIDRIFLNTKKPKKYLRDLFIAFGGTDPLGYTQKVAKILQNSPYHLHIITPTPFEIPHNAPITLYSNLCAAQMAALMHRCDGAISAGGGTLIELAMAQVPTLIIPTASNQTFQAKNWENTGAMQISNLHALPQDLKALESVDKRAIMIAQYQNIPFGTLLASQLQAILTKPRSKR